MEHRRARNVATLRGPFLRGCSVVVGQRDSILVFRDDEFAVKCVLEYLQIAEGIWRDTANDCVQEIITFHVGRGTSQLTT